ncbi:MAG: hypothetical protein KGI71_06140 [Patescibacteria group bacterium]|nr:hypothetical protein [Patescibacteria group bacterium]
MPLKKGKGKKVASKNISEFHKGKTYKKTKAKFGKETADKQAVAVGMRSAGMSNPAKSHKRADGPKVSTSDMPKY